MNRTIGLLVAVIVLLAVLVSAGSTIVALAHAAVPLVLAIGALAVLTRVAWWLTGRW
jgi:hypothetical protein